MSTELILLVPVLVAPIVLLLAFAGCGVVLTADADEGEAPPKENTQVDINRYHQAVAATGGALCHWKLDEPDTATTAFDSVAPPNHGLYRGQHRADDGVLTFIKLDSQTDKATAFNGSNTFVQVAHSAAINPPLDFSVEAWIRPDGAPATRQVVVGSYRPNPATGKVERGFVVEVLPGTPTKLRGRVAYKADSAAAPVSEAEVVTDLVDDFHGWFHVVLAYRGSDRRLSLYVNTPAASTLQPRTSITLGGPAPMFVPNRVLVASDVVTNLRIGAGIAEPFSPANIAGAAFFAGRIDQVALYEQALDPFDVRLHFVLATDPTWPKKFA